MGDIYRPGPARSWAADRLKGALVGLGMGNFSGVISEEDKKDLDMNQYAGVTTTTNRAVIPKTHASAFIGRPPRWSRGGSRGPPRRRRPGAPACGSWRRIALSASRGGVPPFFLGRAGQDSPRLTQGVDRFVQAALAANTPLALMNHPGGRHGFDMLDDDLFTRTILARTLDFLNPHPSLFTLG